MWRALRPWMLGAAVLTAGFVLGRYVTLKIELPEHMVRVERVSSAILLGGQARMASLHVSLFQNVRAGNLEYVESSLCKLIKADESLLSGVEPTGEGVERVLGELSQPHIAAVLKHIHERDCGPS